MCILALAWQAHPRWHLVIAGNRDELHARPAAPLARWSKPEHVIAGQDLKSGGTWMGISEQGRFAVVTNLRGYGDPQPDRVSRGALVADVLAGAGRYADPAKAQLADFNPFNLILADRDQAQFVSNRPHDIRTTLAPGVYGLSNGPFDEPWPKTMQLKAFLLNWIVEEAHHPEQLFDGLRREELPDVGLPPETPSDAPFEPRLSPIFIRNPVYGTRCSTVVAVDVAGEGVIIERRFAPDGEPAGETALSFRWTR
jgi:uncharacterized protein with NRDE domain